MNKNYAINFCRIVATLFVVGIHSLEFYNVDSNTHIILLTLFSLAVPFFFLTSGYLMNINLDRKETLTDKKSYFFKYIKNLLVIYFICIFIDGLFIYLEKYFLLGLKIDIMSWIFSKETLFGLHTGGYFYPIWFLMALVHSHLIIYIFRNKLEVVVRFSIVIYIFLYILQILAIIPVSRNVFSIGLLFTSLGYLISKYKDKILVFWNKRDKYILILLSLLAFILFLLESKFLYFEFHIHLSSYLFLIILTIINFIIMLRNPNILKYKCIITLGDNTFGVYLIHSVILRCLLLLLNHFNISQYFIHNIFVFIAFILVVYFIAYIIYYYFIDILSNIFKNILIMIKNRIIN